MTERYPNPPLLELIAEVQWFVSRPAGVPQPILFDPDFYDRFASALEELGFTHSERMVPEGFPTLPGQVVARFRNRRDQPPLYQIGPGIFSANGLPPTYSNWEDFAPFLYRGLGAVSQARSESREPFASIKLRYIDAFGPAFLQGKTASEFIEQDLGFATELPDAISSATRSGERPLLTIQVVTPIAHGGELQVSVGQGLVGDVSHVIMDVAVAYPNVEQDEASTLFDEAHSIAHEVFSGSTQTVKAIMREIQS